MGTSRRLASVVAVIVVLQLLVPAFALVLPDKPHRLGWQMYSGLGQHEVEVVDQDGVAVTVQWDEVLAWPRRPELDWTQHLPEHLCQHLEAEELTVTAGPAVRTMTC